MRRVISFALPLSVLSSLAALSLPLHAQDNTPTPPAPPSKSPRTRTTAPALTALLSQLDALRRQGAHDEVIQLVSERVEAAQEALGDAAISQEGEVPRPVVDGRLYFKRAQSEEAIGWYEQASNDMQLARAATPEESLREEATEALARLKKIGAACPTQIYDVKQGDDVIFRVYYDSDNPITQEIIRTLPMAFRVNAQILGATVVNQPVFIFDSAARASSFAAAREVNESGSWAWARGGLAGLYFSLEKTNGESMVTSLMKNPEYLRNTVAHEFNHTLLRRGIGTASTPRWFREGLANVAGDTMVGRDGQSNDHRIRRLAGAGVLLSPAQLEASGSFTTHMEASIVTREMNQGTGVLVPDPYGQSTHMVRFLLANMRRGQLIDFLNQVREARSFDRGLQAEFGMNVSEFYNQWSRTLTR